MCPIEETLMAATRLGLTFQEAQAVLRNIRNAYREENNLGLLSGYEDKVRNGKLRFSRI